MGQPITTLDNLDGYGTGGFFVRLSGPDPDFPSAGAETFLLTNRHVVCDGDNNVDIMHPLSSGSQSGSQSGSPSGSPSGSQSGSALPLAEPIRVIKPGPSCLRDLMIDLEIEITQRTEFITDAENDSEDALEENDPPNLLYAQYHRELPILKSLMEYCLAHDSPESQVIGTVAYSPALGVRHEFHNDWALIRCGPELGAGTGAYNNSSCISGINNTVKCYSLMSQVDPRFAVNVEGDCKRRRAELEFITLNTVFDRSTVEHHYAIPEVSDVAAVIAKYEDEDKYKEGHGKDGKFLVYKYGANSASTYGILNSILSVQWNGCNVPEKDYCIVGPHAGFSQPGDSGSAIFGLLPISPPSSAADGNEGAKCGGSTQSSTAVKEGTKPRGNCTPGIIGIVWSGLGMPDSAPLHGVTFATPFDVVLADIEKFTGRVAIDITRC